MRSLLSVRPTWRRILLSLTLCLTFAIPVLWGHAASDVRDQPVAPSCPAQAGSPAATRPERRPDGQGRDPGWTTAETQIVTTTGVPFTITGINWYGFETTSFVAHGLYSQDYAGMVCAIKMLGFNTIRLPFSNQMWETDPVPRPAAVSACPSCAGLHSRDILANIINYAGSLGLHVVLDDHRSEAGNSPEADGLWYDTTRQRYTEQGWIADWRQIQQWLHGIRQTQGASDRVPVRALASDGFPAVLGYDLRNEPHTPPGVAYLQGAMWGSGDVPASPMDPNPNPFAAGCASTSTCHDWRLAAERAADTLLGDAASNGWSSPLLFVEGISQYPLPGGNAARGPYDSYAWGSNLLGVKGNRTNPGAPIVLNAGGSATAVGPASIDHRSLNHQVVYSVHEYGPSTTVFAHGWFNSGTCYESGCRGSSLESIWTTHWAYIDVARGVAPFNAQGNQASYPWAHTGSAAYFQAPIYLGEFGTGNTGGDLTSTVAGSEGQWFTDLVRYIQGSYTAVVPDGPGGTAMSRRNVTHLQWTYWALNTEDRFALLGKDYTGLANLDKEYAFLCAIQQPSPQVSPAPCSGAPSGAHGGPIPAPSSGRASKQHASSMRATGGRAIRPSRPHAMARHRPPLATGWRPAGSNTAAAGWIACHTGFSAAGCAPPTARCAPG